MDCLKVPNQTVSRIKSHGSETGVSESDDSILSDTHDVWDNTDLELRGIDIEKEIDAQGQKFNIVSLLRARYG